MSNDTIQKTPSREIRLVSRPSGLPTADDFAVAQIEIEPPRDGQVLVRNLFMSVDPFMRGRMNSGRSYIPPFALGKVLEGGAVGPAYAWAHHRLRRHLRLQRGKAAARAVQSVLHDHEAADDERHHGLRLDGSTNRVRKGSGKVSPSRQGEALCVHQLSRSWFPFLSISA